MSDPVFETALTWEELKTRDKKLAGMRLVSLAAYGRPVTPLFAAIWLPIPTRERQLIGFYDPLCQGKPQKHSEGRAVFHPVLVAATGDGALSDQPGIGLAFSVEKFSPPESPPLVRVLVGRDPSTLIPDLGTHSEYRSMEVTGFDVAWHHVGVPSLVQTKAFAILFQPGQGMHSVAPFGILPIERVKDQKTALRNDMRVRVTERGWARLHHAVPAPKRRGNRRDVVTHFRSDTYEPWPDDILEDFRGGTIVSGPMTPAIARASWEARRKDGWWPIQVGANGHGNDRRLCVTYAPARFYPLGRSFVVINGAKDAPAKRVGEQPSSLVSVSSTYDQIDELIEKQMRFQGGTAFQFAVALNGRLKACRSYTLGEQGWPITQPSHKFRYGSCAKFLIAIMATAMDDDGAFLKKTLPSALGTTAWDLLQAGAPAEKVGWFSQTTIADCLRHQVYKSSNSYNAFFLDGRRHLPIEEGDYSRSLLERRLDFLKHPPRTQEVYSNEPFVLVAEAIAHAKRHTRSLVDNDGYYGLAKLFFGFEDEVTPAAPDRVESGKRKEVPCRGGAIGWNYNTSVSLQNLPLEQWPALQPSVYCKRDAEVASSGNLAGSAIGYVRALQRLMPSFVNSSFPAQRLSLDQVLRLATTNPEAIRPASGAKPERPGSYGLGCEPSQTTISKTRGGTNVTGTVLRMAKGGSWEGCHAEVVHYHVVYGPGNVDSLSIAAARNDHYRGADEVSVISMLYNLYVDGVWDNDVDLF